MTKHDAEKLRIAVDPSLSVSGLLPAAASARSLAMSLLTAPAPEWRMPSWRMSRQACATAALPRCAISFPIWRRARGRPDAPALAHATVRAAVVEAARLYPDAVLVAGGKSFGGRMTSQAQALQPLPGVRGLVFFGFPLHPAGKPSVERAKHLSDVHVPMLFIQGTRDKLAEPALMKRWSCQINARTRRCTRSTAPITVCTFRPNPAAAMPTS